MAKLTASILTASLCLLGTNALLSQEGNGAASQADALTAAQRKEVIEAIGARLAEGYVYEDVGRHLARRLETEAENGSLVATDPREFASLIQRSLRADTNDCHLIVLSGSIAASLGEVAPTLIGPMFGRSELMPDGIGYIEVRNFQGTQDSDFDHAMAAVEGARALIFDVRENAGGGRDAVRRLASYLFSAPTHLLTMDARGAPPDERWTLSDLPGPRFADVPVYVLTSGRTFSAGEGFAFALKVTGRATVVGERTGGGGHFGRFVPLPHGFQMFLPIGRTYDPRTGKGWQVEGVTPDIAVPGERALEAARDDLRTRLPDTRR